MKCQIKITICVKAVSMWWMVTQMMFDITEGRHRVSESAKFEWEWGKEKRRPYIQLLVWYENNSCSRLFSYSLVLALFPFFFYPLLFAALFYYYENYILLIQRRMAFTLLPVTFVHCCKMILLCCIIRLDSASLSFWFFEQEKWNASISLSHLFCTFCLNII